MSFLLYADALGMGALLQRDPNMAEAAMSSISRHATACLQHQIPGTSSRVEAHRFHLTTFNDSVFFWCSDLKASIHYACQLAIGLLLNTPQKGGPIAMRGAIASTARPPVAVWSKKGRANSRVQTARLLAQNLAGALVADKRKVLGPRIVVPEELIDTRQLKGWDLRLQARLMRLGEFPERIEADTLQVNRVLRRHYDLAWMNVDEDRKFENLLRPLEVLAYHAAENGRAVMHAAAAIALYRTVKARRHGLASMLSQMWTRLLRHIEPDAARPRLHEYGKWLEIARRAKKEIKQDLSFPLDMSSRRDLSLNG